MFLRSDAAQFLATDSPDSPQATTQREDMASISKMENGKFRAQVYRDGVRKSKVFATRKEAKQWGARQEYLLENAPEVNSRIPFGDILDRYGREKSSKKKGARPEIIRIERIRRDRLAKVALGDLRVTDFAEWRDKRLTEVKSSSVRRELEQMSAVLRIARTEWALMSSNPLEGLKWPSDSPPRDRIATQKEIEALRISAGSDLFTLTGRTFQAWLFAIETGMRAGEIAGLRSKHIDGVRAHLSETKNGDARDVPLSKEALRLLSGLPESDAVFNLSSSQISSLWRKLRDRAGVKDLTFHDSRHMAVSRMARKLHVLDLARVIGHRDIKMLMRYYNTSVEDLASQLD
ncbi:integrase [Roseobacter cerasinus]|uniref:Integrase n=2 Tax=Roseobacter cerasinus TaxID=2602289 RepID=A0A640VWV8_9RHOB|nr:integrase [Roseobacter cerasinus]